MASVLSAAAADRSTEPRLPEPRLYGDLWRFLLEILAFVGVSTAILMAVFAPATGPPPFPVLAAEDPTNTYCHDASLTAMEGSRVRGRSWLCVSGGSTRSTIEAEDLTPGVVYTAWLTYFDDPAVCRSGPCADADLLGEDPAGVLGRIDATVADQAGRARFDASYRALTLSSGSHVRLLLIHHGPAAVGDNRAHARQLLTRQAIWLGDPSTIVGQAVFALRWPLD
jgi:hypothetical protein